jgi:hypothetical protein
VALVTGKFADRLTPNAYRIPPGDTAALRP